MFFISRIQKHSAPKYNEASRNKGAYSAPRLTVERMRRQAAGAVLSARPRPGLYRSAPHLACSPPRLSCSPPSTQRTPSALAPRLPETRPQPSGRCSPAPAPPGPPRQNKGMWGGGEERRPSCSTSPSTAQGDPGSRPKAPAHRSNTLQTSRARRRKGSAGRHPRATEGRNRKVAVRGPLQAKSSQSELQSRSGSDVGGPEAILASWKATAII